jgi:hypothetical protein
MKLLLYVTERTASSAPSRKYSNGDSAARNRQGSVVGRSSQTFNNTHDSSGHVAGATNADAKLLFRR